MEEAFVAGHSHVDLEVPCPPSDLVERFVVVVSLSVFLGDCVVAAPMSEKELGIELLALGQFWLVKDTSLSES